MEDTKKELKIIKESDILINFGDSIIVYQGPGNIQIVELEEGKSFDNRFGNFKHSSFVGIPFGSKVFSKGNKGFVYVLRLDPSLFTKTLLRRTQVLYFADISQIIFNLDVLSGSRVIESGSIIRNWKWFPNFLSFSSSRLKRANINF